MGFSRQEYWSALPCPSPGDLPDSEIKPTSLVSPALAGGFSTSSATWEAVQQSEKWSHSVVFDSQSCLTLSDAMDCSLLGFSTLGIFQARILEWVAISFSRRSSRPRDWTRVSRIVGRCFTIWATRGVVYNRVVFTKFTVATVPWGAGELYPLVVIPLTPSSLS